MHFGHGKNKIRIFNFWQTTICLLRHIVELKGMTFEVGPHLGLLLKKKNKQTRECSLAILLAFAQFFCFMTLHLTCGFNMTKFLQCQSETCFKNEHFSEQHTMPIGNMFQDGTCFRTAQNIHIFKICPNTYTTEFNTMETIFYIIPVFFIPKINVKPWHSMSQHPCQIKTLFT